MPSFKFALNLRTIKQTCNHSTIVINRHLFYQCKIYIHVKFRYRLGICYYPNKLCRLISLKQILTFQPLLPPFQKVTLVINHNIKSTHKSLIQNPIVNMPAFTALFPFHWIFAIAAPDNPSKPFIGGVPHLPAENFTTSAANNPASKRIIGCRVLKLLNPILQCIISSSVHLQLDRFPHFFVNNGGMAVFHIVLRHFTIVVRAFLTQKINRMGLLEQCITFIFRLFVKCCGLYRTEIFSVRFFMNKIL